MQYIDENLLLLHRLHDYIYYDIQRKWAEVYEDEIRAIIAKMSHLSGVPHLREQLAPDRPLWEILALVDLYEEQLQPAMEARDAGVAALVAEAVPMLQKNDAEQRDFCSLYPMADGTSAYVSILTTAAQSTRLVLQGLDMTGPMILENPIWWELTRQESGYRLTYLTDAFEKLELDFDGMQVQRQFYHAGSCFTHVENPWLLLIGMAAAILEKHEADPTRLNEKELVLLPMLHALSKLEDGLPAVDDTVVFAPLLEQLQLHNLTKAEKALQAFIAAPEKKREGKRNKLLVCLRQVACEPLWRQLYDTIWDSQQGLPFATGEDPDLPHKRQAVTNALHEMGFQGEYPFFWQEGPKKKFALLRSYEQDYLVGMEPRGFYMVHAVEAPIFGCTDISFIAGTVFVKERAYTPGMRPDIFTAMFEEKGRRSFQNVLTLFSDLTPAEAAIIAGKKARLEKIDKKEKKALLQRSVSERVLIAFSCLLGYGIMVVVSVFSARNTGFTAEDLRKLPGMLYVLLYPLLFGGFMTIISWLWRKLQK